MSLIDRVPPGAFPRTCLFTVLAGWLAVLLAGLLAGLLGVPAAAQDVARPGSAGVGTVAEVPGLAWQRVAPNAPGVPPDALAIGIDAGRVTYACRVRSGGLRVGKLINGIGGVCLVPMSGAEVIFEDFEVLTGPPWALRWLPLTGHGTPNGGLVAGQAAGRAAVLCQVDHMGGVHPGMVIGGRCHFGLNGKEIMAVDYRFAAPNPPGQIIMRHAFGGWVPGGALTSGTGDGANAVGPVLCLAQEDGHWLPGHLDGAGFCAYAVAPDEVRRAPGYTVIVGDPRRVAWVTYEGGALPRWEGPPERSVRIGGQNPQGPPHEVCRAEVGGTHIAGRVLAGRCLAPWEDGRVVVVPRYEVLHYVGDIQTVERPPLR